MIFRINASYTLDDGSNVSYIDSNSTASNISELREDEGTEESSPTVLLFAVVGLVVSLHQTPAISQCRIVLSCITLFGLMLPRIVRACCLLYFVYCC